MHKRGAYSGTEMSPGVLVRPPPSLLSLEVLLPKQSISHQFPRVRASADVTAALLDGRKGVGQEGENAEVAGFPPVSLKSKVLVLAPP